jgi:hypothetical protein
MIEQNEPYILAEKRVLIKSHQGYISVKGQWLFKFYNHPSDKLTDFADELKLNKLDVSCTQSIIKLLKDKEQRLQLKSCYEKINKNVNLTSLVMYHGPIGIHIDATSFISEFKNPRIPYFYVPRFTSLDYISEDQNLYGTILFGDFSLKCYIENVLQHFGQLLDTILVVSVPHHGSKHNWNRAILSRINNYSFWIISAGLHSRFGHPHAEVIFHLEGTHPDKLLLSNNEHNGILIHSRVLCS